MRPSVRAAAVVLAATAVVSAASAGKGPPAGVQGGLAVTVVSSPAHLVSGGDARVEVDVPAGVPLTDVTVTLNGDDVSGAFAADPEGGHRLEGVVTGLPLGASTLRATVPGPGKAAPNREEVRLVNHPLQGPMFSGPHQTPFGCATDGHRAAALLGPITDPATCETAREIGLFYKAAVNGQWTPYDASVPADAIATAPGTSTPLIVRWERGVVNRFIYSLAHLVPPGGGSDLSRWNGVLLFTFQGGVAIGRYQGSPSRGTMLDEASLGRGYAIAYSTGTRTNTHYNLQLGGETAIMVKDRFVSAYAEPRYTVAVGGSGGAIQQYVYAQNHPGLIDAGVPQSSYPDMVTQTIHIGDCELLERWADRQVLANPASMWRTWTNRTLIEGLSTSSSVPSPYAPLMPWMPSPGSSECINGWRGLSPLALNPHFGSAPGVTGPVEWTHWGDLVNIYGTDEHGFARVPWDNVGVQYGLKALTDGALSPAQFLDLNANVGSWKRSHEMVQEGCPYVPPACATGDVDVWSARNMNLSPDGVTPAARRQGDRAAQHAAYRSGMVFRGEIDIPIIDWRHYLEHRLDMHNTHQSFAARQRMLNWDGDASNQVVWFTDARPGTPQSDQTGLALQVIDEWMANIRANPDGGVAGNRPAAAVDSCFATDGSLIAAGEDVWDGILDGGPAGACTRGFPLYSTSRIVAGGPIEGGIFACHLQPVERAIAHGLYAPWTPSAADVARLKAIFPTGVCDYTKGDAGMPPELQSRAHR